MLNSHGRRRAAVAGFSAASSATAARKETKPIGQHGPGALHSFRRPVEETVETQGTCCAGITAQHLTLQHVQAMAETCHYWSTPGTPTGGPKYATDCREHQLVQQTPAKATIDVAVWVTSIDCGCHSNWVQPAPQHQQPWVTQCTT